jgi:metal-sulfur cluster biosynthetic enzyme
LLPTPDALFVALEPVVDPELGVSIVDLGLVYSVEIDIDGAVEVEFTATATECPLVDVIQHGIVASLSRISGVTSVNARFVWDPPWTPEMMLPEAVARIGRF